MSGVTVAIRSDDGQLHKITKIVPYKENGFAALVPYHSARQGFLMKSPLDYSQRDRWVSTSEVISYTADDQVKLSIHLDGFVQFSGVDSTKIISGFDTATGQPKGLGQKGNTPIPASTTGPLFGIVLWGLEHFDVVTESRRNICEFAEGDFYKRDLPGRVDQAAYVVEFFLVDQKEMCRQRANTRGPIIRKRYPYEGADGLRFDLRIIDLPGQPFFLGAVSFRVNSDFPSESGFTMSGPGYEPPDGSGYYCLAAMYPRNLERDTGTPLDRTP